MSNHDEKMPPGLQEAIARSRTSAAIENNFVYHPLKAGQPALYEAVRSKAKELAMHINEMCPDSRERALALTNLEQAVFWANAAIARN
jgi:hypothetical protein